MRPVGRGRKKKKGDFIIHQCLLCGLVKNNKVAGNDSEDEINKLPW
jgi:hypothetical protein